MTTSSLAIFFLPTLLLLLSSFSLGQIIPKPQGFVFTIKKDTTTNQYYTSIQIGSNSTKLNVVIDLGGKFAWFNDLHYFNAASSYRPILCHTQQCTVANGFGCTDCFLETPPIPGCTNNTCSDYSLNPFSGTQGYGGLGGDVLSVYSTSGDQYKVNNFPFQFSVLELREELARPAAGVIGLGRTRIALQAQLASAFNIPQKFALCIPSSGNNGEMIIGEAAYTKPFPKISKSLLSTPLIRNPVSAAQGDVIGNLTVEYFIDVKSIRVGGKALSFNKTLLLIDTKTGAGGTNIRTVRGYTNLHRSIYKPLVNEFVKATAKMGIERVASVAPFGACFDSKTIATSRTGIDVPTIDLVLQSSSVYWRFYGANSMVRVGNNVVCLAFVEGPMNPSGPTTSIVVGGYQMENHLLEFHVDSSSLRFSSSLLQHGTSCSQFGAAEVDM